MTLTDAIKLSQSRYDDLTNGDAVFVTFIMVFSAFCIIAALFSHQKTGFIETLFTNNATTKLRVMAWGATGVLLVASVVAGNLGSNALSERRAADDAYAKVEPFLHEHYGLTFKYEYGPAAFLNGKTLEADLNGKKTLVQVIDLASKPKVVIYHGETLPAK